MSFDKWFGEASQNKLFWESSSKASKMGFEAGTQSRQAEIDELQNKYDAMYRAFTVADDCRKEWHRCYVGIRQREDELQERIDEVLDYLGNCHRKIEIEKKHIENLLKGKENEH